MDAYFPIKETILKATAALCLSMDPIEAKIVSAVRYTLVCLGGGEINEVRALVENIMKK